MTISEPVSIFWFRRDLRLEDNAALYHALKGQYPVLPVFIFDTDILDKLEDKADRRVAFIHQTLTELQKHLIKLGSSLEVWHGSPEQVWKQIIAKYNVKSVFANHDYEPGARKRDRVIYDLLKENGVKINTFKDQCIFEYNEVLKDDGKPYTVFTPYSRKWKAAMKPFFLKSYPTQKYFANFLKVGEIEMPSLEEIGFKATNVSFSSKKVKEELIRHYNETRDFPAIEGTTRLSLHLRFGTVSIRQLAQKASELNQTWLNELIWRDFYMMIIWHFPHSATVSFKPDYDRIEWRNNEKEFEAWCTGATGYPIVDAGMRELNETGFMHNRVRMITASFLTKHLLIDWRWGEAYFAKKLLDYDLSANVGGWQWAAGSGCDAAPYFRVFNPALQTEKFDKKLDYVRKWVPDFKDPFKYPKPVVDHAFARERCLRVYQQALKNN